MCVIIFSAFFFFFDRQWRSTRWFRRVLTRKEVMTRLWLPWASSTPSTHFSVWWRTTKRWAAELPVILPTHTHTHSLSLSANHSFRCHFLCTCSSHLLCVVLAKHTWATHQLLGSSVLFMFKTIQNQARNRAGASCHYLSSHRDLTACEPTFRLFKLRTFLFRFHLSSQMFGFFYKMFKRCCWFLIFTALYFVIQLAVTHWANKTASQLLVLQLIILMPLQITQQLEGICLQVIGTVLQQHVLGKKNRFFLYFHMPPACCTCVCLPQNWPTSDKLFLFFQNFMRRSCPWHTAWPASRCRHRCGNSFL